MSMLLVEVQKEFPKGDLCIRPWRMNDSPDRQWGKTLQAEYLYFIFLSFGCIAACGILVLQPVIEPVPAPRPNRPPHWMSRVLTTRLQGKSPGRISSSKYRKHKPYIKNWSTVCHQNLNHQLVKNIYHQENKLANYKLEENIHKTCIWYRASM